MPTSHQPVPNLMPEESDPNNTSDDCEAPSIVVSKKKRTKIATVVDPSDGEALVNGAVSPAPEDVVSDCLPPAKVAKKTKAVPDEKKGNLSALPAPVAGSYTMTTPSGMITTVTSDGLGGQVMTIVDQKTGMERVVYAEDDLRNPLAVNGLFQQSLLALQNAPLPRHLPPDHAGYTDIRIRPTDIKIQVQQKRENLDGESKWETVAYGSVRVGAETGAFAQTRPKLDQRDYFVAKNYADIPQRELSDGTVLSRFVQAVPHGTFTYALSGPAPAVLPASVSAKAKKPSGVKKE
jgi:hypothetical protein